MVNNQKESKKTRILVIGDRKKNPIDLSAMVSEAFPECEINYVEAPDEDKLKIETLPPHAILLDVKRNGKNSFEACKKLRAMEYTANTPLVILLPSTTAIEHKIRGLNSGADVVMVKPLNASELGAQLRALLRIKNAGDELRQEKEDLMQILWDKTSALRESQEQLKNILDNNPDHILHLDPDLKILWANQTALNLNHKAVGQYCYEAFTLRDSACEECPCLKALETQKKETAVVYQSEFRGVGKSYWESVGIPLTDRKEKLTGIIKISRDISESKKKEEQIKNSLHEKEILLKEIHHRVKNNMQVISSLINLQANRTENLAIRETLKESQLRIHALSAIHETLYQSESLTGINLKTYVSRIVTPLLQTYATVSPRVTFSIDTESLVLAIEQAMPLGLVINELVSNALKYAFPGEKNGTVSVSLKRSGQHLVGAVSDNGVGIAPHVDLNTSDTLGLNLVEALVETQLNGSLELIRSKGTHFKIRFQIKEPAFVNE